MVAFVLCKLVAGLEQKALTQIRGINGIKDVYLTFGSWDAICTAEADTAFRDLCADRNRRPTYNHPPHKIA